MTNEELEKKAEEYARETRIKDENTFSSLENECISETQDYEGHSIYFPKRIEKAYKDGYEQGQHNEFIKQYLNTKIAEVEKENEELKEELAKWKEEHHEQVILANEEGWNRTQLQIENTELKKDLQTAIEANKKWLQRDTKLEAQIEKMKCCGNCRKIFICKKSR